MIAPGAADITVGAVWPVRKTTKTSNAALFKRIGRTATAEVSVFSGVAVGSVEPLASNNSPISSRCAGSALTNESVAGLQRTTNHRSVADTRAVYQQAALARALCPGDDVMDKEPARCSPQVSLGLRPLNCPPLTALALRRAIKKCTCPSASRSARSVLVRLVPNESPAASDLMLYGIGATVRWLPAQPCSVH